MATAIRCRYCTSTHDSVAEVKECWALRETVEARQTESRAEWRDMQEEERRLRLREVGHGGVNYRSGEKQQQAAAERLRLRFHREGFRTDGWGEGRVNERATEVFGEALDELFADDVEDVEEDLLEGVDGTDMRHWYAQWTIADERIRTSQHSAFALSEDQEVPGVSQFDPDYMDWSHPDPKRRWTRYGERLQASIHIGPSDGEPAPAVAVKRPVNITERQRITHTPLRYDKHVRYFKAREALLAEQAAWRKKVGITD